MNFYNTLTSYKSWRRLVNAAVEAPVPHQLVVLDGNTGTAKTEVLLRIAAAGGHVIDLESLAHHRGSVFGHHATAQPNQKQFESSLARSFARADPSFPLLLEAESARIGALFLPGSIRRAMLQGKP
jgi:tRNA 2-selenouridine synthase